MSYWHIAEGLWMGLLVALVPGLHPLIYGPLPPHLLAIVYGAYVAGSLLLAKRGIYHAETAGMTEARDKNLFLGLASFFLLLPATLILYSIELPDWVLLLALLAGSAALIARDAVAFLLSGALGLVALRAPVDVAFPLASGLFYIFGLLHVLDQGEEGEGDWRLGLLASLLTGYLPALPPSAWSRLLGNGDVAVSALLTPLFSLVAYTYGKTRSAMTAYLTAPDNVLLINVGLLYIAAFLTVFALGRLLPLPRLPREVGLGIMAAHALLLGPGNLLLFLASLGLVLATMGKPSAYFGFIVLPTLLYYS